jgi:hypothetical protein
MSPWPTPGAGLLGRCLGKVDDLLHVVHRLRREEGGQRLLQARGGGVDEVAHPYTSASVNGSGESGAGPVPRVSVNGSGRRGFRRWFSCPDRLHWQRRTPERFADVDAGPRRGAHRLERIVGRSVFTRAVCWDVKMHLDETDVKEDMDVERRWQCECTRKPALPP